MASGATWLSDIPNHVQMRYIEEWTASRCFRTPSGHSNGNTFDYQGRQLSATGNRRVVLSNRTHGPVIAAMFQGKALIPNDPVLIPTAHLVYGVQSLHSRQHEGSGRVRDEACLPIARWHSGCRADHRRDSGRRRASHRITNPYCPDTEGRRLRL